MLKSLIEFVRTSQTLTVRNVFVIFLLCLVLLSSYYTYRKIQSLQFIIEKEIESGRDKFWQEFKLEDLKTDLIIRDILVESRVKANVKHVSLWGYHNGMSVGPFPFKKLSLIDETSRVGTSSMARDYQNLPLNLYINTTIAIWETPEDELFHITADEADRKYHEIVTDLRSTGVYYYIAYPIRIIDYPTPVGLYVMQLSREEYNNASESPGGLKLLHERALNAAQRIELIFNLQYHRTK